MTVVPTPAPPGWGNDKLTTFIENARNNAFASFVHLRGAYTQLADINDAFHLIGENLLNPPDWFVALFLLRTHSSYLGGSYLALCGQLPEAYMLLRGCLENALYGFYFHHVPDSHERWLRRHDSDVAKRVVQDEFRIRALLRLLAKHDENLGSITTTLYETTIDFGGHPNERSLSQVMKMSKEDARRQLQVNYLTGHTTGMDLCIRTTARVGVCGLKIFEHAMKERYALLGLSARLEQLKRGL